MPGARDGQLRVRRGADSPPWALQMFDDDLGLWLTLCQADVEEEAMRAGIPILRGPYVVDFSDLAHEGDTLTLWTPAVGDLLLAIGPGYRSDWTNWDSGQLDLEPADSAGAFFTGTNAGGMQGGTLTLYVFPSTAPVQVRLHDTGGIDATAGHMSIYALVARAVAP